MKALKILLKMSGHDVSPTKAQADSISSTSTQKDNDRLPASLAKDAEVITPRGNVITKDGVVVSTQESDTSLDGNIFSDPDIEEYYKQVYENAKYECRHVFDAKATWTPEEEKAVVRKLDWRGELLNFFHCRIAY